MGQTRQGSAFRQFLAEYTADCFRIDQVSSLQPAWK